MTHYHAAVWLSHDEARIFYFNADDFEKLHVMPEHTHQFSGGGKNHKHFENPDYYKAITEKLKQAGEILVTGPGPAKSELMKYLAKHDPALVQKVVGVETVDHPTDKQIVAYARLYYNAADKMRA